MLLRLLSHFLVLALMIANLSPALPMATVRTGDRGSKLAAPPAPSPQMFLPVVQNGAGGQGEDTHAPVAAGDADGVDEDASLALSPPGVLGDDSDVDGNTLVAALGVPLLRPDEAQANQIQIAQNGFVPMSDAVGEFKGKASEQQKAKFLSLHGAPPLANR